MSDTNPARKTCPHSCFLFIYIFYIFELNPPPPQHICTLEDKDKHYIEKNKKNEKKVEIMKTICKIMRKKIIQLFEKRIT